MEKTTGIRLREIQADLKRAMATNSRIDLSTFLADLVDEFGGTRMLAKEVFRLFQRTKSHFVQQKILMMIQSLVHATTIHRLSNQLDPSELSDQDLSDALRDHLELVTHAGGTRSDSATAGPLPLSLDSAAEPFRSLSGPASEAGEEAEAAGDTDDPG